MSFPFPPTKTNTNNIPTSSFFDRSSEATGNDFFIEQGGDIAVNNFGDLELLSGSKLITQSLLRRIYTAKIGYARFVRSSGGGVELVNEDYASSLYDRLSSGRTSENDHAALEKLIESVSKERRVKLINFGIESSYMQPNALSLSITYSILGETDLKTLGLVLQAP